MTVSMRKSLSACITLAVMALLTLCLPVPAFAVSMISTTSGGDGVFQLQGIGIEDAAALEITVQYDTATLGSPRVVEGPLIAGAMLAVNPNIPGTVRIVAIRLTPVRGSGVIATLTFSRKGSSPGSITSLSAKLAAINGASLPSLAQINNPPADSGVASNIQQGQGTPAATTSTGQTAATTGTSSPTGPAVVVVGLPSKTGEGSVSPDSLRTQAAGTPIAPEAGPEPQKESMIAARRNEGTAGSDAVSSSEKIPARKIFSQKGTLDRFREFGGVRTAGALVSLFEQENFIGFRQEPSVAMSDGKSRVNVTFVSTPGNKTTSDVAVMGARLISMRKDPDSTNTWIVELQPDKGVYEASLTVSQGGIVMTYPLTIAPRVDIVRSQSKTMNESDLNRYLQERIAAKSPKLDLNKDGKWDYRDDYILTANYLDAIRNSHH
jgi:hypothetical protein